MKVVLAGGSGVLGRRLARDVSARGDEVVVLTRSATDVRHGRSVVWDGRTVGSWAAELEGAAVVNLCGAIVDRRPSAANIDLLTRSRVEPTLALVRASAGLDQEYLAIVRGALDDPALSGVVHATSPAPITNAELMAALRRALRRPAAPPTPAWAVHLGAVFLRTDPALALTGRRCVPQRLLDGGFTFAYPEIGPALADLNAS